MIFQKRPPQHCLILETPKQLFIQKKRKPTWLSSLFLIGALTLIVSELARAQTREFNSVNEARAGQLLFKSESGKFQQAVHLGSSVDVQINGLVASVTYKQSFKNDSDDWREAVYVFPLAENSAVNHMEMRIGDRLIRAEIKEKAEARKMYEQAKSQGKKAALTEQQRPNLFTQNVANIAPGEEIEITLGFIQQVGYDSGTFSFHLPTTLTPRYMPGISLADSVADIDLEKTLTSSTFGWARATDQVPDAHLISPFMVAPVDEKLVNPIEIKIDLQAGLDLAEVSSRNHDIGRQIIDNHHHIWLRDGNAKKVSMDRDFWLEWRPVASAQPEAAVFKEQIDGQDYALLMLLPPQIASPNAPVLAREVIFVIDTSGSMGGTSIEQAKASLLLALDRIGSNDRFNLIEFNSSHRALFPAAVQGNRTQLNRARRFVQSLDAGGGTNMLPALAEALKTPSESGYLKQVLFITDGAVGNEDQLFQLIHSQLNEARLFTVGIGSAPNSHFMRRAAEFGRGSFEYIGNQSDITERMSNLFRKLESPVLSDLKIQWPGATPTDLEPFPARTPDLYSGEPLILSVKGRELNGQLKISGTTAAAPWSRTLSFNHSGSPETHNQQQNTGIATLWARKKIAALMDEKIRGRAETDVRAEVLKVALPHKLISAYTSLVAVEQRISREPSTALGPGIVANAVADGQKLQPQTYPNTATWQPFNLLVANLSMLLLLLLYRERAKRLCIWSFTRTSQQICHSQTKPTCLKKH